MKGFLAQLSPSDQQDLLAAGRQRHYASGSTLFAEGESGELVVLIVTGRTKVVVTTPEGTEIVLSLRGPGDLVGELAVIDHEPMPRLASVIAMEAVECRVLRAADFRAFLEEHPLAALELLRMVAARLRDAERRRVEFGAVDTARRLARLLVELAENSGQTTQSGRAPELRLTQHELAGLVGASRESVARALTTLRGRGLVRTGRRSVVVENPQALRRYGR